MTAGPAPPPPPPPEAGAGSGPRPAPAGGEKNTLVLAGFGRGATGLGGVLAQLWRPLRRRWATTLVLFEDDGSLRPSGLAAGAFAATSAPAASAAAAEFFAATLAASFAGRGPDAVLLLGQPWKTPLLVEAVRRAAPRAKLVFYMAVEGEPAGDTIARAAACADRCILYTRCARDSLAAQLRPNQLGPNQLRPNQLRPHQTPLHRIGHGLDPRLRRLARQAGDVPAPEARRALRRELFPDHPALWAPPLVLTASRVYPRKRLDLTLAGFALAARRAEGNLYLHLPGVIRYEADKLRARIRELGLEDRVFLNLLDPLDRPLPFARLVALLRAGDIGLTTAMGEGWGLGPFEHAATGAAQVVPDHTSFRENWGVLENGGVRENGRPAALLVPTGAPLLDVHEAVTMRPPEPAAVGEALLTLLRDPARRLELSRRACTRARSPDLAWPSLAQRFDKVLREVVGKNEEATNQPPPPPPPRARRRARP